MSLDFFVDCFANGQPKAFKRSAFDSIFGEYVVERTVGFSRLRYPDQAGGAEVYIDDADEIGCVMFNHCGGDLFWQGVYELVKAIDGVIWWANVDHISAVASVDVLKQLSAIFVDENANPAVIANGQELVEAIGRS